MVRHGIRGAVIALVCGSAVATAMGVLSKSNVSGGRLEQDDVSQRVRFNYEDSGIVSLVPRVKTIPSSSAGTAGTVPLPVFMTNDTAQPVPFSVAAAAALEPMHGAKSPRASAATVAALNSIPSAGATGGNGGGYAYAYSSGAGQKGLSVDLATTDGAVSKPRLGSDAAFSGAPISRGGSGGGLPSELFGATDGAAATETNPGTTNSTVPSTAQNGVMGPASPAAPVVQDTASQGATLGDTSPGPSNAVAVPAPGAGLLMGLGGVALLRRKR